MSSNQTDQNQDNQDPTVNNDLRKLSMDELSRILQDAGISKEEIATKTRWERVQMIRALNLNNRGTLT